MWIRIALLLATCASYGLLPQRAAGQAPAHPVLPPAPAAIDASRAAYEAQLPWAPPHGLGGPQGFTPVGPGHVPCGDCTYWIVSSRKCLQYGRDGALCCPLEYLYAPGDGNLYPSTREQFHASLDPSAPVTVMVHGSFVDLEDVKTDSRLTFDWLRAAAGPLAANVVFFTWPSEGPVVLIPQIDVGILGRRGEFTGLYLAQFISELPSHRVSLLGHSHGARAVASSLHVLGGGLVQGYQLTPGRPQPPRIRAVFAAGALDHHWLNPGERYGNGLCRVEAIVNLNNRFDLPLTLYPLRRPFSNRALARAGFTWRDRRQMGWQVAKIHEIDVSQLIGSGHMWPNYYEQPQIARAIVPFLFFADDATAVPAPAPAATPAMESAHP